MHRDVKEARRSRVSFTIASGVIGAWLLFTIAVSWPTNVLTDQSTAAERVRALLAIPLTQAWAFFTRSPQDPSLLAYRQGPGNSWTRADTLPSSEAANLFGLSRNQRAQPTELAVLASKLRLDSCTGYLPTCLARPVVHVQPITNTSDGHYFCGRLRLVIQQPVKWGYRHQVPSLIRVSQYADAAVTCPAG